MATSGPTALPAFLSGDADFRSWAQGVHNAITAAGLVQTADTGQINFATVARPGAANTSGGYTVYRFDDALQATAPVFIKVEYGTGATVDRPALWFTVGTGTNGAGTISGAGTRKQILPNQSKTAGATLNTYASGSSSRLSLVSNHDPASTSFGLVALIERFKTPAGAESGLGVFTYFTAQNTNQYQLITPSGNSTAQIVTTPWALDPNRIAVTVGSDMPMCGAHCSYGTWFRALPGLARSADVTVGSSITATNMGATHTYMPLTVYTLSGTTFLLPWE